MKINIREEKHQRFVSLSGDSNPFHTDARYSRRSLVGHRVVHGVHLLLASLEKFISQKEIDPSFDISSLRVKFLKDVGIDEDIYLKSKVDAQEVLLEGMSEKKEKKFKIRFTYEAKAGLVHDQTENFLRPVKLRNGKGEMKTGDCDSFPCGFDFNLGKELFPLIFSFLGTRFIDACLCLTRCVGMRFPGLNSVFSGLRLDKDLSKEVDNFQYILRQNDERFGLVTLDWFSPNYKGKIEASFRPVSVNQLSYDEIYSLVKDKSLLKGKKAIVIGGSRGLGEVATKILVSMGAEVGFTYLYGEKEAREMLNDIGSPHVKAHQFNVLNPDHDVDFLSHEEVDLVFYFASPKIYKNESEELDEKLLNLFRSFYIEGFQTVLKKVQSNKRICIFYPSTEYIDTSNKSFREYCIVKREGELMAIQENAVRRNLYIYAPRIPKLVTDQTNSFIKQEPIVTAKVIYQELLKFVELYSREQQ